MRTLSRREMLELAIAAGCLSITRTTLGQETARRITPEQIMGPFYPIMRPLDHDMDLTVVKGKRGQAQGKVVHLTGRVLNSQGKPVGGAKIEVWQANTHGRYDHPRDINPAPLDPNFQGYGLQVTDAQGRFRFKTIKPGAYPINPINRTNMRPPHIHFDVTGGKERLVTQMYFPNEPLNETDIIFRELGPDKDAAVGQVLPITKDLEPDSLLINWEIVLEKG